MRGRGDFRSGGTSDAGAELRLSQALGREELASILKELPKRPLLAGEEGIRLSLAGAQDKIAVRIEDGEICLPLGGAPSTHILKPAVERFEGVVFNEALCMKLAAEAGLPAASVETRNVDGMDYLLVERYDRIHQAGPDAEPVVDRLHQEDFCQARGIVPERKYQKEGGPSLKQCFELLREVSSAPVIDLARLLEAVIYNYLAGNNDAHGKNFSLLYRGFGTADLEIRLAPLYDIVSTVYYPELSRDMAMKIGGEYSPDKADRRKLRAIGRRGGLGQAAWCVDACPKWPTGSSRLWTKVEIAHPAAEKVARMIRQRSERVRDSFRN